MHLRILLVASFVSLSLCQTSCKQLAREYAERTRSGVVEGEHGQSGSGDTSGTKPIVIPDDFPRHFILYPGATKVGMLTGPDFHSLTLITSDDPNKVMKFYDDRLNAIGFLRSGISLQNGTRTDTYKHVDGRALFIATSTTNMTLERRTMIMLDDRSKL